MKAKLIFINKTKPCSKKTKYSNNKWQKQFAIISKNRLMQTNKYKKYVKRKNKPSTAYDSIERIKQLPTHKNNN